MSDPHRNVDRPEEAEQEDFSRLFARAKSGSDEAREQLVDRFRPYLLLLANAGLDPRVQAKIGASDVVQESMMAAIHDLDDFRGETLQEWLAWLRTIVTNDLRQAHRAFRGTAKRQIDREIQPQSSSDARRQIQGLPADQTTPAGHALVEEEVAMLKRVLMSLPEDYRKIVQLRHWEGLEFKEIGERMDRSADAVRKLWYRAIRRLEKELASHGPSAE